MRVFSVEMLVKEEGAAVVQAALNRLKKETQAVAAEMKTTSQAVTGTGAAMKSAGQATEIAKDRAAKAAIGFAAVGQSIARTGSLTADAGNRIIEAGSQIAAMFGAGGLVVSGILAGLAAVSTAFFSTRKEVAEFKKTLDGLTDTANLQGLQDALDKIVKGTASKEGKDSIVALSQELVRLQEEYKKYADNTGPATSAQIELAKRINTLRAEITQKRDAIVDLQRRIAIASDVERFHTKVVEADSNANKKATQALKERASALSAIGMAQMLSRQVTGVTTFEQRADTSFVFDQGKLTTAIQAAIPKAGQIVLSEADRMAAELAINLQKTFQDNIGNALVGGIVGGIEQAVAAGNISQGFKAMTSMMLAGIGDAMIKFGTATAAFSKFMKGIKDKLATLQPEASLAMSFALIAAGAVLKGAARGMFGGQSGGAAFSTASFGGAGFGGGVGAMTLPTTQLVFGNTSATTAAGMQPRQPMNVTVIGPNDPTAQRTIQELMVKANSRGRLG